MKKTFRIICLVIAVSVIASCFTSCKNKAAMTLDGYELDYDVYKWIVSYCKTEEYNTYLSYLNQAGEDISLYDLTSYNFWQGKYGGEERTLAEIVKEEAIVVAKSYISADKLFDENGLKITDEDEENIKNAIETIDKGMQQQSGTTLKDYLKKYDVSIETYRKILTYQYKTNKLLNKLMSPGGRYEVTDKMVTDAYDSTVEAYGYSNVNHILIYTVEFDKDGKSTPVSDEKHAEIKDYVQKIYDSIESGEAAFEDYLEISQDKYSPDGYLVNINTSMTEDFVENSIKMKIGEVRMIESEGIGFHIIKKYDITDAQKTEIEDFIKENLETEAQERILNINYDKIEINDELISECDPVYAQLLL